MPLFIDGVQWMLVLPTVNACSDQLLALIEVINASNRLSWDTEWRFD